MEVGNLITLLFDLQFYSISAQLTHAILLNNNKGIGHDYIKILEDLLQVKNLS